MYLIQPFAQQAVSAIVPWHADNIWNVMQIYIVALVFSDVTYRYIEAPCISIGSRVINYMQRGRRPAELTVAPVHNT
jgi:peptidoglycan/LPS O-acetylase OafA/YrhL